MLTYIIIQSVYKIQSLLYVCVKHGLCDVIALYRFRKEKCHSYDAALFSHGVSGVDLYGASAANDLK